MTWHTASLTYNERSMINLSTHARASTGRSDPFSHVSGGEKRQKSPEPALDAPVARVSQADVPMPYNHELEKAARPDARKVVNAVLRMLGK